MIKTEFLPDEASMILFGARLAQAIIVPAVIYLNGELGAGKTTLARGFLRGLSYTDRVKSPTYTLVESYELPKITVFHFDLYRLHDPEELEFMGIQDYIKPSSICLFEWPGKGAGFLPLPDLSVNIKNYNAGRQIDLIAESEHGQTILQRLTHG